LISHSKEIIDVVSGNEHLLAILEEEDQYSIYSWGNNSNGQLGLGTFNDIESHS